MQRIILFCLLLGSGAALAESGRPDELARLDAALNSVRHEQQAVYQSYQMTKERRLQEVEEGSPLMVQHPYGMSIETPPPDYDAVIRAQMEREQRIQQQTAELRNLSLRYLELENQRKALIEQIQKLEQHADE